MAHAPPARAAELLDIVEPFALVAELCVYMCNHLGRCNCSLSIRTISVSSEDRGSLGLGSLQESYGRAEEGSKS